MPEERAAEITQQMQAEIKERGLYWRERLAREAAGDDEMLLRLLADHAAAIDHHLAELRIKRDEAAARLRERGVPMTRVAALARVSDSYLARRLFGRGAKRKIVRGA